MTVDIGKTGLAATKQSNINVPSIMPTSLLERLSQGPKWMQVLYAIAQDKRHDVCVPVLELWKSKLSEFPDNDVTKVLVETNWGFFPSVDEVLDGLETLAEERLLKMQEQKRAKEHVEAKAAKKEWDERCIEMGLPIGTDHYGWLMQEILDEIKNIPDDPGPLRAPRNVIAQRQSGVLSAIGQRRGGQ
jgi:hypothetical protein